MLEGLTSDDFHPRVGQAFRLVPPEGAAPLDSVLSEVVVHNDGQEGRASFSLLFRAPADADAPQGIFGVEHEGSDALEIFLVPVGPDAAGEAMLYQAVFG